MSVVLDRGPRRRNPSTRHDVADVLDAVEHLRWCLGGDQADALRSGLESEAISRIGRVFGINGRHEQATDLVIAGHNFRRPSAYRARGSLGEEFAAFYAVRREPAWAREQYAETLRLLVNHLDDEAREVTALVEEMGRVCPAMVPPEGAPALAAALADEWREVLKVTEGPATYEERA